MNIQSRLMRSYKEKYSLMLPMVADKAATLEHSRKVSIAQKMAVLNEAIELQTEGVKIPEIYKVLEELVIAKTVELDGVRRFTYSGFREMLRRTKKEGVKMYAKPGKIGNQNAAKHKIDRELVGWLYWLRFSSRNLSNEHIKRIIRHNCLMTGKTIPSDGWVNTILADGHTKSLASTLRYDRGNRHQQKYNSVLHGLRAPMADDRWEADGTRVNLLGWQEDGRAVFLYMIFVQDNHSGDILGWQFTTSKSPENRWAYLEALKMAVNRTGSLPRNLAMDRFPGHNTQEWQVVERKMEQMGCRIEYTERAEGKQHLERSIGTFQSVFLSQSDYYYGEGVKSTRQAAHRPLSYLKEATKTQKKLGFGFEQMAAEAERFVQQYRTTKLTEYGRKSYTRLPYSPEELYQQSDKINSVPVQAWQMADLFWAEKELSLRNRTLKHEVMHELCVYPVKDYGILKRLESTKKAIVKYEASDLSVIYVFDPATEAFMGTLDRQEMTVTRGPGANGKVIGDYLSTQKAIEEKRIEEIGELLEPVDETSLNVYWGKEAKHRAEEQMMSEAFSYAEPVKIPKEKTTKKSQKATRDIYDYDIPVNNFKSNK